MQSINLKLRITDLQYDNECIYAALALEDRYLGSLMLETINQLI